MSGSVHLGLEPPFTSSSSTRLPVLDKLELNGHGLKGRNVLNEDLRAVSADAALSGKTDRAAGAAVGVIQLGVPADPAAVGERS